jgi:lipoprotein-releasing system ATP-binding protein
MNDRPLSPIFPDFMPHVLLRVEGLHKSYGQDQAKVEVLRGIDLTVEEGERVGILGVSGAGKSTLLHLLGALDVPDEGTIVFDGMPITGTPDGELAAFRNRAIGFVFQFHHLLPEFTALENVMMPLLIGGEARGAAKRVAAELLAEVGLSHRLTHKPGELSGGEQQRVAIARALVRNPRLLLADEPTGNLDLETASQVHDLLENMNHRRNLTMIAVTHNPQFAARMTRCVRLRSGRIVGETEEVQ